MKRSTSISIGIMIVGGMLASSAAWSRQGGIPQCEMELAECTINLTEKEGLLQVCDDALAQCEAGEGQAFPATGQTTCWDSSGTVIPCAGTGQDGEIQAGANLSYTDTGLTIIDNNTKLEWMKQDDNDGDCASYPGYLDKDCAFTWDDAFAFVASLNANTHGGHTDWRVPNAKELQSIVNNENEDPAVSAEFDTDCVPGCTVDACSCTAATFYWSSTSIAVIPSQAWDVEFNSGGVNNVTKSFGGDRVRGVRGGL